MQKYLETFFRHRRALVAPVVVALVISVGFVIVQPRSYDASARVWFQSTAIAGSDSSNQVNAYLNPSEVALGVFNELLSTRSFCVNIGHRGPLADYLSNNLPAPDPVSLASGLLDKVRGGSGNTSAAARQQILDDTIVSILQKQIAFTATGPQIVTIDFVYTNPYIAKGTLRVLLDEFKDQMLTVQRAQTGQQLSSTNQQVTDQQKTVNTADAAVARYLALHPELLRAPAGRRPVAHPAGPARHGAGPGPDPAEPAEPGHHVAVPRHRSRHPSGQAGELLEDPAPGGRWRARGRAAAGARHPGGAGLHRPHRPDG